MSVWLWENKLDWLSTIVLWDGENTYWIEEMKPSPNYKKMRSEYCDITTSQFFYIGEL